MEKFLGVLLTAKMIVSYQREQGVFSWREKENKRECQQKAIIFCKICHAKTYSRIVGG
jgi:hypothetical protein